ncbi:methylated-DNA--[protein]-cysteine S-methyltransferase [Limosilactobacillus sp. BG-MG3-A]|uniref:Methylated-DNA--[protein]-cysteine S-methyltransferase n=1 Tax=Limosilactobacillus agrestis TaxID=2759748 RepID=A0A7W3UHA0_9LACO|nr:methylated-DNA--[protein]-cysteine S-methyltransferase [Limosilactobacillus agrestis]MBB1095496.1 methylated-DNA--[protein]-cysteine S-methyltransferase [Limosilactobacillus agrestis]MBB1098744.1 methylated-DNA--[protein]-cysteine S-methyltransferase [Limosilactobacillus agrestis]MCD7125709.1 methylated-DNA--[protein]-cysteine S-methyltransferase [Limosilactobacillus agrestis]
MNKQFIQAVFAIVDTIPLGRVATYGQIARIIGHPKNARLVGKVLGKADKKHPCHRVVTSTGRLVPGWLDQRPMLLAEGIPFRDEDHVDIKRCLWQKN